MAGSPKSPAPKPAPEPGRYPFPVKMRAWLRHAQIGLKPFAKAVGIQHGTLNGWVKRGRRVPMDGLRKIAAFTGYSVEYWADDSLPFPPPRRRLRLEWQRGLLSAASRLSEESRLELLRLASDPKQLELLLSAWRHARE